jgi:hypothetical protein
MAALEQRSLETMGPAYFRVPAERLDADAMPRCRVMGTWCATDDGFYDHAIEWHRAGETGTRYLLVEELIDWQQELDGFEPSDLEIIMAEHRRAIQAAQAVH